MKRYEIDKKRNVVIIGHGGSGKTSLTEAILFDTKMTDRLGRIEEGNTVMDYDPDEVKRGNSISSGVGHAIYKDYKINIIDTPGFADFIGDVIGASKVADIILSVICGVNGIEVGTEKTWELVKDKPKAVFINKLDKEMSDFKKRYQEIKNHYKDHSFAIFTFPIGNEADFKGVVDIVSQKAYIYADNSGKVEVTDVPGDIKAEVEKIRNELVEFVAETNDALTEKYLEEGVLTEEEIQTGLKEGIRKGMIIPVFAGSAVKNIGIHPFFEALINYFPNPSQINEIKGVNSSDDSEVSIVPEEGKPLCGFVFKTVSEPHVGEMFYVRIFSGQLKSAADFYNVNKGKTERAGQLMVAQGKKRIDVEALDTGDIGVMVKLKETENNRIGTCSQYESHSRRSPRRSVLLFR